MSLTRAAMEKLAEKVRDLWIWPLWAHVIHDNSGLVVAARNDDGSWPLTDAGCWQAMVNLPLDMVYDPTERHWHCGDEFGRRLAREPDPRSALERAIEECLKGERDNDR